jgi:hypothetical protein
MGVSGAETNMLPLVGDVAVILMAIQSPGFTTGRGVQSKAVINHPRARAGRSCERGDKPGNPDIA